MVVTLLASGVASGSSPAVVIPGGRFDMGCRGCNLVDAVPVHPVEVSSFRMQAKPVSNEDFHKFVAETGYVTIAERAPDPAGFPDIPRHLLVAGSAVFTPGKVAAGSVTDPLDWWMYVGGANWRHPEGPGSTIKNRENHPVVHIAFPDAEAYCLHNGMRLPTEAEFEFAARGGLKGKRYSWGDELKPGGRWMANIWQGKFPGENSKQDGYVGTSPVASFPANGFGLHDMTGNVWQWTSDWYRPDTYQRDAARGLAKDPRGPSSSHDPSEPGILKRVQRGGSFLCSEQYCTRYLVGSRGKGAIDSAGSNTGFRCAKDLHERRKG